MSSKEMLTIRLATEKDIPLIRRMAEVVFRQTYADILSPAQMEYMVEWMYSEESLRGQIVPEGKTFCIAESGMPAVNSQATWNADPARNRQTAQSEGKAGHSLTAQSEDKAGDSQTARSFDKAGHSLTAQSGDKAVNSQAAWNADPARNRQTARSYDKAGHSLTARSGDQAGSRRPAGYVSFEYESTLGDGRRLYHLQKLYVLPEFQGRGLGKAMLDHVIRSLSGSNPGGFRLELNVNRDNPAVGFYEHCGLRRDRQGDFPIGNGYFMNDYIYALDVPAR